MGISGFPVTILTIYGDMMYNTNMKYKSNQNVVYSCKYHVVWCPKYRRKVLTGTIEARLKEVLIETSNSIKIDIIEMEIMPDRVHLLLEVDPQYGIHKAIKHLKGRSSFVLRNEFKELTTKLPTLWTCLLYTSPSPRDRQKSRMPS